MTSGVAAAQARIAAIQSRFAVTNRWEYDPEPVAPYRTGGLYLDSSVAAGAGPAAAGAEAAGTAGATPASLAATADTTDPTTAATQQRLLGRTFGVSASTLVPEDGAWIRQLPEAGQEWAGVVADAARANGLEPELLAAVAWTASGFDAQATSDDGALGLFQLLPATAARLGVDAGLPLDNVAGGARELRRLLDVVDGDVAGAVAAHHAGEAVGLGPRSAWSAETRDHVASVLTNRRTLTGQDAARAPASRVPASTISFL